MRFLPAIIATLFWGLVHPTAKAEERPFTKAEVDLLTEAAKGTGWSKAEMRRLLSHKDVNRIEKTISDNVLEPIQLKHERYKHYTYREAIDRAQNFKDHWRTQLARASKRYRVDEDVIVGVLLVETNFGLFKGDKQLLSVFSSLYVDAHDLLAGKTIEDAAMKKRLETKQEWALGELKALLRMGKERGFNLVKLKGSYAGAFGLPQFLPSSYMQWARNSTGGKRADLFYEPDAIHSVASFLKAHGYRKGAAKARNDKAIWHYNHSDVYVDTVRAVASQIKADRVASRQ